MEKKKTVKVVYSKGKKKMHHKKAFTLPLAPLAGLGVGLKYVWSGGNGGTSFPDRMHRLSTAYTGWNPAEHKWNAGEMREGVLPLAVGGLVHYIVGNKLGINRMLARAGVPILRI